MDASQEYREVLKAYPAECQPERVDALGGAGGFSGARFWRLHTPRGLLCLRRWPPEHPTVERLEFIQAVLWQVDQQGFDLAPLAIPALSRKGYVRHGGTLWELSPWLAGKADYQAHPNPARLQAALRTLAAFHQATTDFPLPVAERGPVRLSVLAGAIDCLTSPIRTRSPMTLARIEWLAGERDAAGAHYREALSVPADGSERDGDLIASGRVHARGEIDQPLEGVGGRMFLHSDKHRGHSILVGENGIVTASKETLENGSERIVLKLKPHLAPIKVAVLPLARNKPEIVEKAKSIKNSLMATGIGRVFYEDTGNIGKGYRRHDEVGTPFCVTVDFDTLGRGDDPALTDTVTVRDRDTMAQERIAIHELAAYVRERLK